MTIYLGNAFSLQMLNGNCTVQVFEVKPEEIANSKFTSVVGHADTAEVLSGILGKPVEFNRASIKLGCGDKLYVAQVIGGRLPEGAKTLPEGFKMKFLEVEVCEEF